MRLNHSTFVKRFFPIRPAWSEGRLAQTPALGSFRFPAGTLSSNPRTVPSILFWAMRPCHRVYIPRQLQFVTARTYRRTPLFLSDRFQADVWNSTCQALRDRRLPNAAASRSSYPQRSILPVLLRKRGSHRGHRDGLTENTEKTGNLLCVLCGQCINLRDLCVKRS